MTSEPPPLSHWLLSAPPFYTPAPDLPPAAEVVVLGAGIMGCATAYWLARAGRRPVVIERNPAPAVGATGRNGGLHVAGSANDYAAEAARYGREAARALFQLTLQNQALMEAVLAREGVEALYSRPGFLVLAQAAEAQALQTTADWLRADGFPAEWLTRAEAIRRLGAELGPAYVGALWKPGDGQFHSTRYTQGVALAAERLGARFAYHTEARAVAPGPGGRGWQVVTTRGAVLAEQVVVAVNAWAGDLFPELAALLTPVRGHVVLTPPAPVTLTPWSANEDFEYGRQLETGQLLVGGMRRARPDLEQGQAPAPGENAPPPQPEVVAALTDFIPRLFPGLAGLGVAHFWTGVMDFSPDRHPLAGPWPGRPGLWLLVGFSGHGMPYSQVLPKQVADLLVGAAPPALPAPLSPARFLAGE